MTIAQDLAAFCCRAAGEPLAPEVRERARLCVADHLHAAMRGANSGSGRLVARYVGERRDAEAAALRLGTVSTVHEIDDVHRDTSMHPGSVVVAAALGAACEARVDDARLLAAIAVGYEVATRLSIAAGERHYHYFHSTATCGTVAAAATAAVIYSLDPEQTAHALGIAVTTASGLWEDINDAAIGIKHLHSGFAAERGVRAAKLALLGARSAREGIEGRKGFLAALARPDGNVPHETAPTLEGLRDLLLHELGDRWAILRNIYKRYPFCLGCFEPLEGIRSVMSGTRRPRDDIAAVLVEMYPPVASLVDQQDPQDQLQAKFSAAFAVALVLSGRDPENPLLPREWLSDREVRRWYPKIRCRPDPSVPRRTARVTVTWNDGTSEVGDRPLRNLDGSEVIRRFSSVCRECLGDRAALLETRIADLGTRPGVTDLLNLVREAILD